MPFGKVNIVLVTNLSNPMPFFILTGFFKIVIITLLLCTKTEGSPNLPKLCQRQEDEEDKCEIKPNPERLTCRKNLRYHRDYSRAKAVFSCSWSLDTINPEEILDNYPFVRRLTIRNGNVTGFLTDFPKSSYLEFLALVDLNIGEVGRSLFAFLENLKFLDLSRNRLKHFPPEIIKTHPSLLKVILIDNPWNCSSDLKWILEKSINSKLANKNLVRCGSSSVYPGKPVYFVMSLIKKMEKDCPKPICTCTMNNIVWDTDQTYLIPVITVDCTNRSLTDFPKKLPANTTTVLLSRNNIASVTPLIRNKAYSKVADIYLDHNKVETVDVLEGAAWLKTFRVLSLRGNQLNQLPVYALDNAFERNRNMAKLYLGHNPWKCDCLFIPDFQHLLIKYGQIIKDKSDIRCSEEGNDDNSNRQIISLSTNSVCRKPETGINPLDVLSAVFASLIFLILGKLVYDYWMYKKTGKLPWIVTKIP